MIFYQVRLDQVHRLSKKTHWKKRELATERMPNIDIVFIWKLVVQAFRKKT